MDRIVVIMSLKIKNNKYFETSLEVAVFKIFLI